MRTTAICIVLLVLGLPTFAPAAEQPAVKKSEQGICHERGSATYQRTRHYESFDSMEACLASGGRLAKNAAGEVGADEKADDGSSSWLGKLGGKIAVIVGMLVIVGAAFLLARRRNS